MAVYRYGERIPKIGKNSYISDSARVIGDVTIADNCYIGHGAREEFPLKLLEI